MPNSSTTPSLAQFNASAQDVNSGALIKPLPPDLLLVVFVHGCVASSVFARDLLTEGCDMKTSLVVGMELVVRFKGTDSTFSSFPKRLEHVLSKSIDNVVTECVVFPEYEVSLPPVLPSYKIELTVSPLGYRLKAIWYPTFNSIQCEQFKLK